MSYKVKINEEIYNIRDGFNYKEEYNEQLDSCTIILDIYGKELNIQPFDNVVIFDDESKINNIYMLVDSYTDEIFNFKQPLENSDRTYTISLFSETKSLERVTLPNLSTTQPINTDVKISVWTQIERIFNHFIPKIKVIKDGELKYVNSISIDYDVFKKFEFIDCPEFQWNNPNLKEVLVDLFSTADCLPIVKNNVLSYYDITKKGNEIDVSKLTNLSSSMSSSDYSSELTMFMKNSIGKNLTKQINYRTLKAPFGTATITTENALITTEKPIYAIKKLVIYAFDVEYKLHKLDVTDRVLEYDEWNILSNSLIGSNTYWNLPTYTDKNGYSAKKHKVSYLFYKRGENTIENFGNLYKGVTTGSQYFLNFIYSQTLIQLGTLPSATSWSGGKSIDPRNIFIELEYESVSEHGLNAGKYLPTNHPENRLFDNQSNSYVDVSHQSIFEYAKINRLGNKIKTIYGEYKNYNDIPNLSDCIDNNILFSREITFYDNLFYFKGLMTENYILKDYYTGVSSKRRSWQIASSQDALTRHEIFKFYIEASFSKKTDILDEITFFETKHGGIMSEIATLNLSISPSSDSYTFFDNKRLEFVSIQTRSDQESYPSENSQITVDNNIEIQGNSLCFNFGFTDNYKSADYSYKDENEDEFLQDFYTYTNEYGNFNRLIMYISYDLPTDFLWEDDTGNLVEIYLPTPQEEGGTEDDKLRSPQKDAVLSACGKKPKILLTNSNTFKYYGAMEFTYDLFKDNREIFAGTIQFEYCSDNENIIITPEFIKNIRAMRLNNQTDGKYIYWHSIFGKYNINSNKHLAFGKSTPSSSFADYITFNSSNDDPFHVEIINNHRYPSPLKTWAISDLDGNVLIAVNGNNRIVHLNLLKSRDCNVYNNNIDKKVIGSIKDELSSLVENSNNAPSLIKKIQVEEDRIIDIDNLISNVK